MKKEGHAESFGWLHRSELDTLQFDTWEAPDGTLYAFYAKGYDPWLIDGRIMNGNYKKFKPMYKEVKNGR